MCKGQENDMVRSVVKNGSSETPRRRAWRDHLEHWSTADRQDEL